MREKFIEIASHVPHPPAVAAFALLIAAVLFLYALKAKESRLPRPLWIVLAIAIIALGLAPLGASTFLQSNGIYRVHVTLLRPDETTVDIAQVKSSISGELKLADGGWELDIPAQARPADGKVTFFASVKDEFLNGKSTLVLAGDYYPTVNIQLVADTSAMVRGVVVDENMVAVAGATVSIEGYPDVALTDKKGNFVLPAHAGKGQVVEVLAQKGKSVGRLSAPAGKVTEIILDTGEDTE
jgi:hypothetical protein